MPLILFSNESSTTDREKNILDDTTPSFFHQDHNITSPKSQQGTDHSSADDRHDPLRSTSKEIDEASSDFENESTDIMSQTSSYSGLPDLSKFHASEMR